MKTVKKHDKSKKKLSKAKYLKKSKKDIVIKDLVKLLKDLNNRKNDEIKIKGREEIVPRIHLEESETTEVDVRPRSSVEQIVVTDRTENREDRTKYQANNYGITTRDYSTIGSTQLYENAARSIVNPIEQKFIESGILDPDKPITPEQRFNVESELRKMFPGASEEQIIRYRNDIFTRKSDKDELKYARRLT